MASSVASSLSDQAIVYPTVDEDEVPPPPPVEEYPGPDLESDCNESTGTPESSGRSVSIIRRHPAKANASISVVSSCPSGTHARCDSDAIPADRPSPPPSPTSRAVQRRRSQVVASLGVPLRKISVNADTGHMSISLSSEDHTGTDTDSDCRGVVMHDPTSFGRARADTFNSSITSATNHSISITPGTQSDTADAIDFDELVRNILIKPDGTIEDSEDEDDQSTAEASDAVSALPTGPRLNRRSSALVAKRHMRQVSVSKLTEKDKRRIHRERIQREMIDTEHAYVANLNLCTQLFYTPLKEMADRDEIKSSDVSTLFTNLDTITSFHALFLKELEKSENFSVDGFALTFLKFSDYLKLYTPYINGYNRAMASYDALVAGNRKFASLMQQKAQDPQTKNLSLMSYLIMPVQRIPRYKLLLSELKKYSEPDPIVANDSPSNGQRERSGSSPFIGTTAAAAAVAAVSESSPRNRMSPGGKLNSTLTRSAAVQIAAQHAALISRSMRDNAPLTPPPEAVRRSSIVQLQACSGPLSRLCLALTKVEEIATYVNESKREEEAVLTFSVVKMNQFNKDTPRVFELDVAAKTLSVLKQENVKNDDSTMTKDMVLTPECFVGIKLSNKSTRKITMWFSPTSNRLLRAQKEWKVKFQNSGDRERFYRLMQVHMLSKERDKRYIPSPIKLTASLEDRVSRLPVAQLAEAVHQGWVAQRKENGWRLGSTLDETSKLHPSLVAFAELHASDRQQLLRMCKETVGAIFALGYLIQPSTAVFSKTVDHQSTTSGGHRKSLIEVSSSRSARPLTPSTDNDAEKATGGLGATMSVLLGKPADANGAHVRRPSQTAAGVPLDPMLVQLVEYLAENAHDSWAEHKMAEGYKYGARTDSVLKTHSNLVAYCDMSSYEQDYDRASAVKVITTLLDLNYTINKDSTPGDSDSED